MKHASTISAQHKCQNLLVGPILNTTVLMAKLVDETINLSCNKF